MLVDCANAVVYNFDLDGIDCSRARVADDDIAPRVCDACTLPFGIRDTGGVYTTRPGNASAPGFAWVFGGADAATGATTWRGEEDGGGALSSRRAAVNQVYI